MVRAVEGPEIVWRSKTRNTGRPAIIKYRTIVCHDAIIARLNEKVKNKCSILELFILNQFQVRLGMLFTVVLNVILFLLCLKVYLSFQV